jgi:hypothetical protein
MNRLLLACNDQDICRGGFYAFCIALSLFKPDWHLGLTPSHPFSLQAHPRRVAKVASQIKREIGEMLIMDDVSRAMLQYQQLE